MKKFGFSAWFFLFITIALFLYSYTQVDLGLTLSRVSIFQTIEKNFQYIGYFNRPLSTACYSGLLLLLFAGYIRLLYIAAKGNMQRKTFWFLTMLITIILTFSYNAFSYDLFNNIFDAKIITHYHQNPYVHNALDFPKDPMLGFMHWTQRDYPYGPVWLFFSVPLSFIGANIFLLTFFLFKIFAGLSYVGTVYFLEKIASQLDKKTALFKTMLFALNPLVLIEGLVSAHNDMTMFFFAVMGLYLLMQQKHIAAGISLLVSIGIKFATVFLAPVFLGVSLLQVAKKNIHWEKMFLLITLLMIPALFAVTIRTTFQPWYLLYVLTFCCLIGDRLYSAIPSVIASFFALTEYVPFLYAGNWNPPIPAILNTITLTGLAICIVVIVFLVFSKRSYNVLQ
ncbi:MAG TPA: hypothetical protein VGT05_04215 [Patescibacteria group bacterium]|nr:hypothetical protein [Patescibacteria group bacterium]